MTINRIEIGKVLADSERINGEIIIDGKYAGYFTDNLMSGEMYIYFDSEEQEDLFYELTDNYMGLSELQQETYICDLLRDKLYL